MSYDMFYAHIRRIPAGCVTTYGHIAAMVGLPRNARQVGYALSALEPENDVPWHRVVNAKGEISVRAQGGRENLQRALLEAEGVEFDANGRISLDEFGWGV